MSSWYQSEWGRNFAKAGAGVMAFNLMFFFCMVYWKLDDGQGFGVDQRAEISRAAKQREAELRAQMLARRLKEQEAHREKKLAEMIEARKAENERINLINNANAEESAKLAAEAAMAAATEPQVETVFVDRYHEYASALDRAIENMEAAIANQQQVLSRLQEAEKQVNVGSQTVQTLELAPIGSHKQNQSPDLDHIRVLMSMPNLSDLDDDVLQTTFDKAFEELAFIQKNKESIRWEDVRDLFDTPFPERERSVLKATCPKIKKASIDKKELQRIMNNPRVAKLKDLEAEAESFNFFLKRRRVGTPIRSKVLPGTMANIQTNMKKKGLKMLEDIVAAVQEKQRQHEEESGCLSEDQLNDIVDEAIEAMYRKEDLRDVIQREILKIHPSSKSLILDADMTIPEPERPIPDSYNLRQLIDSELLTKKAPGWVDALYDAIIAGKNDALDSFVESLEITEQEKIGSIVISKLFELAGKVDIPGPHKVVAAIEEILPPELVEKANDIMGMK